MTGFSVPAGCWEKLSDFGVLVTGWPQFWARPEALTPSRLREDEGRRAALRVRGRTVSFQVGDLTSRKVGTSIREAANPLPSSPDDPRTPGRTAISAVAAGGSCIMPGTGLWLHHSSTLTVSTISLITRASS